MSDAPIESTATTPAATPAPAPKFVFVATRDEAGVITHDVPGAAPIVLQSAIEIPPAAPASAPSAPVHQEG